MLSSSLYAQKVLQSNKFNHVSTYEGLTSSQYNYNVFTDSTGFVWIASTVGLNRYDGHNVRQYHVDSTKAGGLLDEQASQSAFGELSGSGVWFTNDVALTCYKEQADSFSHFQFQLPDGRVSRDTYWWTFVDSINEVVFTSGSRHFFALEVGRGNRKTYLDSIHVGVMDQMIQLDRKEYLLIRNFFGKSKLEIRRYSLKGLMEGPVVYYSPDLSRIKNVCHLKDDEFYVGTDSGLFLLNTKTSEWLEVQGVNTAIKSGIVQIEKTRNGDFILGTISSGIYLFSPDKAGLVSPLWTTEFKQFGTVGIQVARLFLDTRDVLWISTKDHGVYYVDLNASKFKTIIIGRKDRESVVSIAEGVNGDLFFLGRTKVVRTAKEDTTVYSLPVNGQDLQQTKKIYTDAEGRVWVTTLNKLYALFPGSASFEEYLPSCLSDSLKRPGFNDIVQLGNGSLLLGCNRTSAVLLSKDLQHSWFASPRLFRPRTLARYEDWVVVATQSDSLFVVQEDVKSGLGKIVVAFGSIPKASNIVFDEKKQRFCIGSTRGLYYLRHHKKRGWELSKQKIAMKGKAIFSLLVSPSGRIIFTGAEGIMKLNEKHGTVGNYELSDGAQGIDFGTKSAFAASDGRLFFGGTNGVNFFSESDLAPSVADANTLISGVRINDSDQNLERYFIGNTRNPNFISGLKLPYDKNNIELDLSSGEYSDPLACQYKYQLLGAENEEMRPATNNPLISLNNIRDGNYELRIWAANSDGEWSRKARVLSLTVLPPLYRTWWAYTLYVLTLSSIPFTIFRIRLVEKRKVEKEQLLRAKSETREAEAQTQAAKIETSVLRLQMNPHFIFNSLNAVNAFLWKGNKLEANEYLARFALLMRETLNRSTQTLSRLEDTIYSLENYLETEQMRLGNKMNYKFEVDETLDTFSVYFPTMMLQPFVENAIWHGISGLEEQGLIAIRFQPERGRGVLIAEVEDNGRGRRQAAKRNTGHASKSLGITQRRLDLLNMALNTISATSTAPVHRRPEKGEINNPAIEVSPHPIAKMEIVDLLEADGSAKGTLVRLTLPLKYPQTYASDNS